MDAVLRPVLDLYASSDIFSGITISSLAVPAPGHESPMGGRLNVLSWGRELGERHNESERELGWLLQISTGKRLPESRSGSPYLLISGIRTQAQALHAAINRRLTFPQLMC